MGPAIDSSNSYQATIAYYLKCSPQRGSGGICPDFGVGSRIHGLGYPPASSTAQKHSLSWCICGLVL